MNLAQSGRANGSIWYLYRRIRTRVRRGVTLPALVCAMYLAYLIESFVATADFPYRYAQGCNAVSVISQHRSSRLSHPLSLSRWPAWSFKLSNLRYRRFVRFVLILGLTCFTAFISILSLPFNLYRRLHAVLMIFFTFSVTTFVRLSILLYPPTR